MNSNNYETNQETAREANRENAYAEFACEFYKDGEPAGRYLVTDERTEAEERNANLQKRKSNDSDLKWVTIESDSYDDGYADIYEDDDYDVDRYSSDSDYANGVDDAMDDEEWE